jgi:hypothetical protein
LPFSKNCVKLTEGLLIFVEFIIFLISFKESAEDEEFSYSDFTVSKNSITRMVATIIAIMKM